MKQHRFFVDEKSLTPRNFHIKDISVVKHIRLVLRLKKGDEIILFDGKGMEYRGKIGYLDKEQVAGLIESSWEGNLPDKPKVLLAQALPRAGKIDEIIKMNTETGVVGFILFESEYSIPKVGDYSKEKLNHLIKVSQEALRQSEGVLLPEFKGPILFKDLMEAKADHKLLLHSRDDAESIDIKKLEVHMNETVVVAIGPEGGFSPREIELAKTKGFKLVHLNMPILRTETAGIVVSALLLS